MVTWMGIYISLTGTVDGNLVDVVYGNLADYVDGNVFIF